MVHRSRACCVLFDVGSEAYEATARFWSGALGRPMTFDPDDDYTKLEGDIDFMVQRVVPGREGMHIDIETDDMEAEVARLEKLGAKVRGKVKRWYVLEDPAGNPFCVVRIQSEDWPAGTTQWS